MNLRDKLKLSVAKGYEVSLDGETCTGPRGPLSKKNQNNHGYRQFYVYSSEGRHKVRWHQLVAYHKFGAALFGDGIEVRHLDGNKLNNAWGNIAIGTRSQNMLDLPLKDRTRTAHIRSKAASLVNRKLSDDQVRSLRQERAAGDYQRVLASKYGLSRRNVRLVLNGTSYADVQ